MNPVTIRLLNQQLIAPQFSDPAEVVNYMVGVREKWGQFKQFRRK